MHRVKQIREKLEDIACSVLNSNDISKINAEELGEVIDMIKDCTEAMYYHKICESMEEAEEERKVHEAATKYAPRMRESEHQNYYTMPYPYDGNWHETFDSSARNKMTGRVGNMDIARRNYHQSKNAHKGVDGSPDQQQKEMKELERYMQELAGDLTELLQDATENEKNMLRQKLAILQQKII